MILKNDNDELNVVMKFKVDGIDYTIFAMTETIKCFGHGQEGHLAHSCPEKAREPEVESGQSAGSPEDGSQADSEGEQREAAAQENGTDM